MASERKQVLFGQGTMVGRATERVARYATVPGPCPDPNKQARGASMKANIITTMARTLLTRKGIL